LDPDNVRARYNLVYTFTERREYAGALRMIAEALAVDKTCEYRELLLQRQKEILGRLTALRQQEERAKSNRMGLFDSNGQGARLDQRATSG
jgi:hypothetical protein